MSSRPKAAADRVAKWDRRYTADHVKNIIENEKSVMLNNNNASTADLVLHETLTKQVLNTEGVSVSSIADYLAFSREVWAKRRRFAGATLALEVATMIAKWVARGLSPSVLETIRYQVYDISAPVGP